MFLDWGLILVLLMSHSCPFLFPCNKRACSYPCVTAWSVELPFPAVMDCIQAKLYRVASSSLSFLSTTSRDVSSLPNSKEDFFIWNVCLEACMVGPFPLTRWWWWRIQGVACWSSTVVCSSLSQCIEGVCGGWWHFLLPSNSLLYIPWSAVLWITPLPASVLTGIAFAVVERPNVKECMWLVIGFIMCMVCWTTKADDVLTFICCVRN